ncbi:MAG: acetyl-CoA C-acetyltransferase [Acidobacteriota bacterium]
MKDAYILSACRTPIGKYLGALSSFSATQLGTVVVKEALQRSGLDAARVDEVVMGNVLSAGLGQNPARQAALRAGLPVNVSALTINKVCGSGLKAVGLAAQGIRLGETSVVIAGGMESMSNAPYLLFKARTGYRMGNGELVDSMIHDGLWDAYENYHMGCTAELVSRKYNVSREAQDQYACQSQKRAVMAMREGRFDAEIVPVVVPQKRGEPVRIVKDEGPREDASLEAFAKLKPAFDEAGSVTAGNASQLSDGAAALTVVSEDIVNRSGKQPMARIVAFATSGVEPAMVMMAPVQAIRAVMNKAAWRDEDVDLYEVNEAFAAQSVALCREVPLDVSRLNVNGGGIALGHPIGASGARVLTTLLYALKQRNGKKGIASLCLGGGNAVAMAVEMV